MSGSGAHERRAFAARRGCRATERHPLTRLRPVPLRLAQFALTRLACCVFPIAVLIGGALWLAENLATLLGPGATPTSATGGTSSTSASPAPERCW